MIESGRQNKIIGHTLKLESHWRTEFVGQHARPIRNHQKPSPGVSWAKKFQDLGLRTHGEEAFVSLTLDIRIKRAKAFAKRGFITRAIQDLQQLKVELPNHLSVRIQLGLLHYSQGNVLDSELEWESVLEFDPVHREAIAYLELVRAKPAAPTKASPGPKSAQSEIRSKR